ncbi:hemolysin family protein [Actinotignum schaalii]|uniref:hemolysin family protein n=1 Tax=Actinotignum schaalii TaxID=59505 RepID=UPI00373EABB1
MSPLAMNIIWVIVFTLIGAFFAASEIALVSLRQTQIDEMAENSASGKTIQRLTADSNRFLSAVQVGVTLAGFFSASFGAASIAPEIAPTFRAWGMSENGATTLAFVLTTLAISYISIVFGELVPKRIALQSAETISTVAARPLAFITAVLRPVIWFLGASVNGVLRLLRRDPKEQREEMGVAELRAFVASQETIGTEERDMVVSMLSVSDRTVQEVMTPRTEVEFLDAELSLDDARPLVTALEHSRYPVRRGGNDDDVIGFLHIRDMLAPAPTAQRVSDLVRPVTFFPTGKDVLEALSDLRKAHAHLAIVVDEYGGTDGIVTIEDVMEEFVGEIRDEYDREVPKVQVHGGVRDMDGLSTRPEVLKMLGVELPEGPFDTLAGYIIAQLGRMPKVGDSTRLGAVELTVQSLDGRRIDRVRVDQVTESEDIAMARMEGHSEAGR